MTESDHIRSCGSDAIGFMSNFALRTRAFGWLDSVVQSLSALNMATEPPPTFPFLESQCQRTRQRREISSCQRRNTARKTDSPAGGVGAVYRGLIGTCQTQNACKSVIFSEPVDGLPAPAASCQRRWTAYQPYGAPRPTPQEENFAGGMLRPTAHLACRYSLLMAGAERPPATQNW